MIPLSSRPIRGHPCRTRELLSYTAPTAAARPMFGPIIFLKSVLSGRRKSVREQVSNGPSESKARATKVLRQPSSKPMARSAIWSFHTQQGQDHVWQRTKRSWSIRQGDGGLYFGWRGE